MSRKSNFSLPRALQATLNYDWGSQKLMNPLCVRVVVLQPSARRDSCFIESDSLQLPFFKGKHFFLKLKHGNADTSQKRSNFVDSKERFFFHQWQKSLKIIWHLCFHSRIHDSELRLFHWVETQVLFLSQMMLIWWWNLFWFCESYMEFVVPLSKQIIIHNACFSAVVLLIPPLPEKGCYKDKMFLQ